MNAQPLNPADVEQIFTELLAKNGQVTSLEVKEELRTRGFWATQAIVGPAVQDIANQLGVPFTNNGRFNTYTQPIASTSVTDYEDEEDDTGSTLTVSISQLPSTPVKVRTPPADPADREPILNPASGDWTVHDVHSGPSASLAFKAKLTESQAKYAYTLKVTTVLYTDVRAKRLN